jgi:hypothetical protein
MNIIPKKQNQHIRREWPVSLLARLLLTLLAQGSDQFGQQDHRRRYKNEVLKERYPET